MSAGAATDDLLARLDSQAASRRLWARDASLWLADPGRHEAIKDRLGWLDSPERSAGILPELADFAGRARAGGVRDAVLLGMGGSSLAPDVFRSSFGAAPGFPALAVLDTTDPAAILAVRRRVDPAATLVIVSSKSGGTVETATLADYFQAEFRSALGRAPGPCFAAVTDPGSPLDRQARERGWLRVFHGPADVGGRFSALTPFGLVPAALLGADVEGLLASARRMAAACGPDAPPSRNPAFELGAWLGRHALEGRDKLTFLLPPRVSLFADWVEQLVAESTGKEGKGILPVAGEDLMPPEAYGKDRVFAHVRDAGMPESDADRAAARLEAAGFPVRTFELAGPEDLGAEMFRWMGATAVAGMVLGIDPFDQPNVQETKTLTDGLLARLAKEGSLPAAPSELRAREPGAGAGIRSLVEGLLARSGAGAYIAILAYLQGTPGQIDGIRALRRGLARLAGSRAAVTAGLGPRYLHSTGQLHKGGPPDCAFIQLVADDGEDVSIPDRPYTFGTLKAAQAAGDMLALANRGRAVARVHLGADPQAGLRLLNEALAKH